MANQNSDSKVLDTLNELARSIRCPNCSKVSPKVSVNGCGHFFCDPCMEKLNDRSLNNGKCTVCSSNIDYDYEVNSDYIISLLSKKTLQLQKFVSQKIENSKKTNVTLNTPRKMDNCHFLNRTIKNQDQQTEVKVMSSMGVQCDQTNQSTVSTQTDFKIEIENVPDKSLNNNLLKDLLKLNNDYNKSFNEIISGLMNVRSNENTDLVGSSILSSKVIENDPPQINQLSQKNDSIETNSVLQAVPENLTENEKNVTRTRARRARSNKNETKDDEITDINSQSSTMKNKSDLTEDGIFVKPKVKTAPIKLDKSLKRQMQSVESIVNEDKSSIKKSKRLIGKKNKDEEKESLESKIPNDVENVSSSLPIANKKSSLEILNEVKSSQVSSSRVRSRSSSTEKTKYLIMCSNLTQSQKNKFERSSNKLDFEITEKWSHKVTHLVVNLASNVGKKEMITTRSIKYLMAILANKWILSFDWIISSVNSNKFVDEKKYEIRGTTNSKQFECPMLSRTQKIVLFSDCAFLFNGDFEELPLDINEVKKLVEIGGGILVNDQDELATITNENKTIKSIVVTNSKLEKQNDSVTYISIGEFLDAINNMQKL